MDWTTLPDHIIVTIFSYLPLNERCSGALVCKSWAECFKSPYLWTSFDFCFYSPEDKRQETCLDLYGANLKDVSISLDQASKENNENACRILEKLRLLTNKRLRGLKIRFTGENPLFYAGLEFVTSLHALFNSLWTANCVSTGLTDVDLSGLLAALNNDVISVLAKHHSCLEKLNIQNKVLVCKITPNCILDLVQRCRKLKVLRVFQCSVSEDVMMAFTEDDRVPLEHLSLFCRREEKYGTVIKEDTWGEVVKKLPGLRATLWFDHTCPLHKVGEIMKPNVPCSVLRLETFSRIHDEINQASAYYNKTLEKLVVSTTPSLELTEAILTLSAQCLRLNALHVFSLLEKTTVEKILEEHPVLKESGWYTLKYIMEPHPWIPGGNC